MRVQKCPAGVGDDVSWKVSREENGCNEMCFTWYSSKQAYPGSDGIHELMACYWLHCNLLRTVWYIYVYGGIQALLTGLPSKCCTILTFFHNLVQWIFFLFLSFCYCSFLAALSALLAFSSSLSFTLSLNASSFRSNTAFCSSRVFFCSSRTAICSAAEVARNWVMT